MKTISTRFLKAALSVLLVVIMLLSSTITGLAAVVDNADTRANVDVAETSYNTTKGDVIWYSGDYKKIYAWNSSTNANNAGWPGVALTSDSSTGLKKWVDTKGNFNKCIFNDSGQTGDLSIPGNNYLYYNSNWYRMFVGGEKVYLNVNSKWTTTYYNAYFFNTATQKFAWVTGKQLSDGNYEVTAPQGAWTHIIWLCNTGATPSWDNKKYQTGDLTVPQAGSLYKLSSTTSGAWSTSYTPPATEFTVSVETVNGDLGNAEISGNATVEHGSSVTLTATPVDEGVSVTWAIKANSGAGSFVDNNAVGNEVKFTPTADTTIVATFARVKNKVTFNYKDANGNDTSKDVYVGPEETLTAPEIPTYTGYTFAGWEPDTLVNEHGKEYTATYTIESYTITLNADGVDGYPKTISYNINSDDIKLETPLKSGYKFEGWNDGNTTNKTVTIKKGSTGNKEYTAVFKKVWPVTVTVCEGVSAVEIPQTGGATESKPFEQDDVTDGYKAVLTAKLETGYRLTGWTVVKNDVPETKPADNPLTVTIDAKTSITPITEKIYDVKAEVYTNKASNIAGGSVAITSNGKAVTAAAENEVVTFKATAKNNYEFIGWYYDSAFTEPVENGTTAEITHTMGAEAVTLYALFAKEYYFSKSADSLDKTQKFEYVVSDGSYKYKLESGAKSEDFAVKTTDGSVITVSEAYGGGSDGYFTESVVVYDNKTSHWHTYSVRNTDLYLTNDITFKLTPKASGSGFDLRGYALQKNQKTVTFVNRDNDQVLFTKNVTVGSSSSFEITGLPEDKYIVNPTAVTDAGDNVEVAIIGRDCTIKNMPDDNVTITVSLGQLYSVKFDDATGLTVSGETYYKPGENVSITVSATGRDSLKSVTASGGHTQTFTAGPDGICKVTFAMPAENVTLTAEVTHKLKVSVVIQAYDPLSTSDPQTSNFKVDAEGIDAEGYTSGQIKLKASVVTASLKSNYTFAGYYVGTNYEECLGVNTTLNYVVKEDNLTIYAFFARNIYVPNSASNNWTHIPMDFNPSTLEYSEVIPASTAEFKLCKDMGWDAPANTTYSNGNNVTFSDANGNKKATVSNSSTYKSMTLYFKATSKGSTYTLSGKASTEVSPLQGVHTVYLSSGNVSLNGTYDATYFESASVITSEDNGIRTKAQGDIAHSDGKPINEHYTIYRTNGDMEIEFSTTISGSSKDTYKVDKFVVYDTINKTPLKVITPINETDNVYEGSFSVTTDCYIVPVFLRTDQYYIDNPSAKEFEFVFDAQDIQETGWGGFTSVYVYGKKGTAVVPFHGGWPGQIMIPTADGKSFYTAIEIPADVDPQGVTFCNYMEFSVPATFFGVPAGKQQSYDYREPITFDEQEAGAVYFRAKPGDSNYHADDDLRSLNKANFQFEYLKDFNKTYLMNFFGESMKDAVYDDAAIDADYYIVSRGNTDYMVTTQNKYEFDANYQGQWSVDWYVYNKQGTLVAQHLSDTFYHNDGYADEDDNISELLQDIMDKEKHDASYYKDKKIAISYEQRNGTRYDGQWYGGNSMISEGKVFVGYDENGDGKFTIDDMATDNVEDYGTAEISGADGVWKDKVEVSSDDGYVNLKATNQKNYMFVGWYTFDSNGQPNLISKNKVENEYYINVSESYYAVFRPVSTDELVVTHEIYNNTDIASGVPSYGGRGKLYVEIVDANGKVYPGSYSYDGSEASCTVSEGDTYTINIKTDPRADDKFFAWMMQTSDAYGGVAYEEVLMDDPSIIDSSDEVVASFTYTYRRENKLNTIHLYSNIKKVSRICTFVYKYQDRFDQDKYYTVESELKPEEVESYEGNNWNAYYPTYITKYDLFDGNGTLIDTVYGEDKFNAYDKTKYKTYTSYNAISENAPNPDVTQAYDKEIIWEIVDVQMTLEKSRVLLEAIVADAKYTVTYITPDSPAPQTKTDILYNELLYNEIVAPSTDEDGNEFSYWQEYTYDKNKNKVYGDIVGYREAYNYRITEDRWIEARYGMPTPDLWNPTIDSVTYTREKSDSGDFVYTDYLLAFNSLKGDIVDQLKEANPGSIEYGLINVRNSTYIYSEDQYNADMKRIQDPDDTLTDLTITYPKEQLGEEFLKGKIKQIANLEGNKQFYNQDKSVIYHAYVYDLTKSDTTDFNRINYIIRHNLKNTDMNGYAFTCYAYIIVDGTVYTSEPINTAIAPYAYIPV